MHGWYYEFVFCLTVSVFYGFLPVFNCKAQWMCSLASTLMRSWASQYTGIEVHIA